MSETYRKPTYATSPDLSVVGVGSGALPEDELPHK